jgi:hypothetical protein
MLAQASMGWYEFALGVPGGPHQGHGVLRHLGVDVDPVGEAGKLQELF